MCQPHCPTYQVYRQEAESPRGRIAMIQALARDRLSADENLIMHLEHCLGCMACEAICPSKVPYGRLMDNARALLNTQNKKIPIAQSLLLKSVARHNGLQGLNSLIRFYNRSGLRAGMDKLLRLTGSPQIRRAHKLLQWADSTVLKTYYPAVGAAVGNLALFSGCLGNSFDATTLTSSIKVLTRLGYNVHLPARKFCCGALHQHLGHPEQAQALVQANRDCFNDLPVSHIVYAANGCGAQLKQAEMPVPVVDIVNFLLSSPALPAVQIKPLAEKVLLHESCSSLNKLHIGGAMRKLLQFIPDLECIATGQAASCCGAGSNHTLQFPDLSAALIESKIADIKRLGPKYLLSDNLGCSLHLKGSLKQAGLNLEVLHPITLLARQLG